MTINYSTLLGLAKPVTGTESGQWGEIVNDKITDLLDEAIAATATLDVTSADADISTITDGLASDGRCMVLKVTGTPGTTRNVTAPDQSKVYFVINDSNASVVVKVSGETGVTVASGANVLVAHNGTDYELVGGNVTLTGTQTLTNKTLTSPTLTTPALGTPSSGTLTNCTGLPLSTGVTGVLAYANGGLPSQTGNSGKYLTTNGTAASWATVSAGTGDVTGPASSTAYEIPVYSGTTGKIITNTSYTLTGGDDDDIVFGRSISSFNTDGNNVVMGVSINNGGSTSQQNVVIGNSITMGNQGNVQVGYDLDAEVGDGNIVIGYGLSTSAPGTYSEIVIGETMVGKGATTGFYGGSGGVYNEANTSNWATTSDERIKRNIVASAKGLAEILQAQVRNFQYKPEEEMPKTPSGKPIASKLDPDKVQTGFIAQEIQQVFPEAVRTDNLGYLSVTLDPIVYALVNAVKELSAEVESLKAQINGG